MRKPLFDFSAMGRARVISVTVAGTLACVAITLYVDSFNFPNLDGTALARSLFVDIFLPVVLAAPLLYYFMSKLRELAIAQQRLGLQAATDSLTDCLNRGAFTVLVDSYLDRVTAHQVVGQGALLVIDADHFKAINDKFGHDSGDEALRIIAQTIRGALRSVDVVGRLGGEEFGVFLPGCNAAQAERVAERIRSEIAETEFAPAGRPMHLSVSVGGVVFDREVTFSELYRTADQRLYKAKRLGRNRVDLGWLPRPPGDGLPPAAPWLH